jgi:hypothetical protein
LTNGWPLSAPAVRPADIMQSLTSNRAFNLRLWFAVGSPRSAICRRQRNNRSSTPYRSSAGILAVPLIV